MKKRTWDFLPVSRFRRQGKVGKPMEATNDTLKLFVGSGGQQQLSDNEYFKRRARNHLMAASRTSGPTGNGIWRILAAYEVKGRIAMIVSRQYRVQ